jgi:hypothetical protein
MSTYHWSKKSCCWNQSVQTELTTLKEQKTTLLTTLTTDQVELIVPQIDRQIEQLEISTQQTIDLERNISREEERTTNLFFVITLDGDKVIYNEQAEQLHTSAREAITSVEKIKATTTKGELMSIQKVLNDLINKKQKIIRSWDAYQKTIARLQTQWLSPKQAKQIADEQTKKAAITLAIREFSYDVSHENTYWFSVETITKIKNNEEIAVFNELFEKIIIDRYEDITDQNHLDRELPLPLDPYFETITKVTVYENPAIENYLFDTPAKDPTSIFNPNQWSETTDEHVRKTILWEKSADEENDETASDDKPTTEQFCQELNTFSSKRLRQLLFYQHFRTLKDIFQHSNKWWTTLQDSCEFSFTELTVNNADHTLQLPFLYNKLSTQLTIQGWTGEITFPTLLDRFSWIRSFPTLAQSKAQMRIEEELLQTAQLTNEELLLCTSRKDIEEMITAKMSQKLLEFPPSTASPDQIAQKIEHEALLANLWWYMDNTHNTKRALDTTQIVPHTNEQFLGLMPHLVTNTKGHDPLTLAETRTINAQLTNPKMHHLFDLLTKTTGGFEEFFLHCPDLTEQRPARIIGVFNALEKLATSNVASNEEEWVSDLHKLFPTQDPPLVGTPSSSSLYIYGNNKLTKRTQ